MTRIFLAQFGPPAGSNVPALPSPPILERLFLEQPLAPAAFLVLAALAAALILNSRGKLSRGLLVGSLLLALGLGVYILGSIVTTERERMARATRELVDAVATVDIPAADRLLAPDVRLFSRFRAPGLSAPNQGMDKTGILAAVPAALGQYPLKEHAVQQVQAQSTGRGVGTTQVQVRVVPEATAFPHTSWWRISWRRDDDVWRATAIEPVDVPFASAAD
jgi:hypothetical protein